MRHSRTQVCGDFVPGFKTSMKDDVIMVVHLKYISFYAFNASSKKLL